jgi:hypothetical protein
MDFGILLQTAIAATWKWDSQLGYNRKARSALSPWGSTKRTLPTA